MSSESDTQSRGAGVRFSLFGMPIKVPLSGLLGALVIAWLWTPTFASDGASGVPLAAAFAVLLYLGILLHELGHGLTARMLGNHVHGITLWILGGFTSYERTRNTPGREAAIAVSGPLVTLLIAAGCFGAMAGFPQMPEMAWQLINALAVSNLLIGVLNLLPGLPLDGGGLVKAAVWAISRSEYRGTVVAAWCGRGLAVAFVLASFALSVLPGLSMGFTGLLVTGVFAVFLWLGATANLRSAKLDRRIPTLSAATIARRAVAAGGSESVALAVARCEQAQAGAIVVCDATGRPTGIVNPAALAAVPAERRPWLPVTSVTRALGTDQAIPLSLTGNDLIRALMDSGREEMLVVDPDGAIFGVLFVDDVERSLT